MKLLISCTFIWLLLIGTAIAQEPSSEPVGNLAHVMRGILFPNSNVLFDVQTQDPGAPPEENAAEGGASSRFAGIYTGWSVVENSAVALAEVANLLMLPGRLCENGEPVPIDRENWGQFSRQLEEAGNAALTAARAKDRELVSDVTNQVADACFYCHEAYRDVPGGNAERCK